jgi:signal peptidase II
MRGRIRAALLLGTILGLVGCDHVTKAAAKSWLGSGRAIPLLRGLVELRYAENRDIAFSLTRPLQHASKPFLLAGFGVALLAGLGAYAWRRRSEAGLGEQLSIALVVAGALGNLVDRIARGYVVDFVYVHHYSVFNVADVLLVLGVAGLLWSTRARAPSPAQ